MRILESSGHNVTALHFSPDGGKLLCAGGAITRLFDLASGGSRRLGPGGWCHGFAPDGRICRNTHDKAMLLRPEDDAVSWQSKKLGSVSWMAASEKAGRLGVIALEGSKETFAWWTWPGLKAMKKRPGKRSFFSAAFMPDGLRLAAKGYDWLALQALDSEEDIWHQDFPAYGGQSCGPVVSPDGRWVAISAGKILFVHDAATGELAARRPLKSKWILDLAFTADGRFLAIASNEATVKAWETSTWTLKHELAWEIGGLKSIAFSRDGMLGAAGGVKKIVVWDMDW